MSWDPTPGQRKLAFAGVVVALAVAGVYFTLPTFRPGEDAEQAPAPASAVTGAPPAASPTGSPTSSADLEALLPMSSEEMAAAIEVARRFTAAYTTYRHDEDSAAYRRRLEPYVTDPIAGEIGRGASGAPAGREDLAREQVVVTSAASVEGTRLVSADSVVAIVRADQTITSTKGTTQADQRLAVTVIGGDGGWKVSNVAPAEAGNAGDVS
ncbi:MAG: hypothetical protein GEV03_12190 [Streptosporangiales bacterium]|nr:hypothetical protein [Streptosporangiales bacterium]